MSMKHVLQILSIVALVGSGCIDEVEDFEDIDELRPERPACSSCNGILNAGGGKANLSLSTDYSPAEVTNVAIKITNDSGWEWRDYDDTVTVPNDPDVVEVIDNELCTVGSTGQPPTQMYVKFQITDASGSYFVGNYIPFTGTCS